MRRSITSSLALVLSLSTMAAAQAKDAKQAGTPKPSGVTWADMNGAWEGKTLKGKTDSVITTLTTHFDASKQTVTINFPNRKPVAAKVVAMAGDSIILQTDKYESITRKGHMTSVRMVSHVKDHKMSGTFRATFDDGKTLDGTSASQHKLK